MFGIYSLKPWHYHSLKTKAFDFIQFQIVFIC